MNKLQILIAILLAPYLSWGGQQMECRTYGLKVNKDDSRVEITLPQFKDSTLIFSNEGLIFGDHEKIVVTFDPADCTPLKGNLITCGGTPKETIVTPYWTNSEEAVEMKRVAIQLREVQALSAFDGQQYGTLQVKVSGNAKNKAGGSATLSVKKQCLE